MKYDNPFLISKESTPYLYLTENSGIYLNEYDNNDIRYISIPINNDLNDDIHISSIQFWVNYPQNTFSSSASMIEIYSASSSINILSIPETGNKRSVIDIDTSCVVWKNGIETNYPSLFPSEWTAFNISFPNLIDTSLMKTEIKLFQGFVFNNISIYTLKNNKQIVLNANNQYTYNGQETYDQQVGTSLVTVEDIRSISVFSNGIDIFTDVTWEKFEKNVV